MSYLIPRIREGFKNNEIEKMFENLFNGYDDFFGDARYKDKDGNIIVEVECPGFNKENLTVEVSDGILMVQGTRGAGQYKKEIYKRFSVGRTEEVEAEIKDGILKLTFKTPKEKTTKLQIK